MKNLLRAIFILCLALSHTFVHAQQDSEIHSQLLSDLTRVDRITAERLYDEIAQNKDIPFAFPDGCYAKAQKISMLLEERGIISGKAFIEGNLFHFDPEWGELFWTFHVAPFILVQEEHATRPYIIDPYLAKKLLNYEDWLNLYEKQRTIIKKQYFTNRFVYDPSQVHLNPSEYNPRLVQDMEIVFKQMRKRLKHKTPATQSNKLLR